MKLFSFSLIILSLIAPNLWAANTISLKKESGKTSFLAIGNPSAIRIDGQGDGPEGILSFQEKNDQALLSGQLKVNLKNYSTGISMRDRHMKEKYLEVEKFETATLTIKDVAFPRVSLNQESKTKVSFDGVLDLHGIQKSVQGEFEIQKIKETLRIQASFNLKLSDFNIVVPTFAGITVANTVEVRSTTQAEKIQ